jgi:hypothetical protein
VGLRKHFIYNDFDAWALTSPEDSWVFDKLYVARMAGLLCGPRGAPVPKPGNYIVRPITNLSGSGLHARKMYFSDHTFDIQPGEFWSEFLEGEHLSIDYQNGFPTLSVRGIRANNEDFTHWQKWEKCEKYQMPPTFVLPLLKRYPIVNCEYIDKKLIEIHLRGNPDFIYGNSEMIPVWEGQNIVASDGWTFVPENILLSKDPDYNCIWDSARPLRIGMLVR